MECELYRF